MHKDGRIFPITLEVNELIDEANKTRLFSGKIMLHNSSQEDERHCRLRVGTGLVGSAGTREDEGIIISVSKNVSELFGRVPEELIGQRAEQFLRLVEKDSENVDLMPALMVSRTPEPPSQH